MLYNFGFHESKNASRDKKNNYIIKILFRGVTNNISKDIDGDLLAADPELRVQFLALPEFLRNSESGTGVRSAS
jgi:hypothetical protein